MNRSLLLALLMSPVLLAHAASSDRYWENCPGPACPAATPPTDHERAIQEHRRRPAADGDYMKAEPPAREPAGKAAREKLNDDAKRRLEDSRKKF